MSRIATTLTAIELLCVVGLVSACGSVAPRTGDSTSASAGGGLGLPALPRPCSFLTHATAARISGDQRVTSQAADVAEEYGYVACVFADAADEADRVAVEIKRVPADVEASALRGAAALFSRGEPVAPFQSFAVTGIGDRAIGEATPGVALIVFARGDVLVSVAAGSTALGAGALRDGVIALAERVAAGL